MNINKVEENVAALALPETPNLDFIYDLLLAYGKPRSSITRLKAGTYNLSKERGEIYWKRNLFFKHVEHENLFHAIDELRRNKEVLRHSPRFIIVTDFSQLLAVDTKTEETLDISIGEIQKNFTFFLPWAGMEKSSHKAESLADVRAAEKMARLYDEIRKNNQSLDKDFLHSLNVFFSRLLFCFFAEDTEVFNKGQFVDSIASYTQKDGSDLADYLDKLFDALDIEDKSGYPSHIKAFPYVNGGLFARKLKSPTFSAQARKLIIECGELNWSQINPDIFGSMIQAVVHPGQRAGLGMHYTSVVNIMKVIEPLFLEELKEEFDKYIDDKQKLEKLARRIYKIKIFDPACGSGNFLIIAYKELRKLEHKIIQRVMELDGGKLALFRLSGVKLENFYGIEIDDFAHEVAILSLWLAKHQMNIEFKELFGIEISLIPLKDTGEVTCSNATRDDWDIICPVSPDDEVYLIGNPPYSGFNERDIAQKEDMDFVFNGLGNVQRLDYIACWFKKASDFIHQRNASFAFVTTNSICQGEQVSLLWPYIFSKEQEIFLAYQSFKWSNNAKGNAGVTCNIIGIRSISNQEKYLFTANRRKLVSSISPYLVEGTAVTISPRKTSISHLPEMALGSSGIDGGYLVLSKYEKDQLVGARPDSARFIKPFVGGGDFIKGIERYCLWIEDTDVAEAKEIPEIANRIEKCKEFRLGAGRDAKKAASVPHRFFYRKYQDGDAIIFPMTSSERREYIPVGYSSSGAVISNGAFVIYDFESYIFGILSSKMHMAWARAIAGKLKTDFRYSSTIVYNNLPLPDLTDKQKQTITNHVFEVFAARENHPEDTLSDMYDPDKMPADLRQAHSDLDEVIDRCYRLKPFENDEDRLAYLFKLYEEMTQKEKGGITCLI